MVPGQLPSRRLAWLFLVAAKSPLGPCGCHYFPESDATLMTPADVGAGDVDIDENANQVCSDRSYHYLSLV